MAVFLLYVSPSNDGKGFFFMNEGMTSNDLHGLGIIKASVRSLQRQRTVFGDLGCTWVDFHAFLKCFSWCIRLEKIVGWMQGNGQVDKGMLKRVLDGQVGSRDRPQCVG